MRAKKRKTKAKGGSLLTEVRKTKSKKNRSYRHLKVMEKKRTKRSSSPETSCVSMKSTDSMFQPPAFSDESVTFDPGTQITAPPTGPSYVSMKSTDSMFQPPAFDEAMTSDPCKQIKSQSTGPSCLSIKGRESMFQPPAFSGGTVTSDPRKQITASSPGPSWVSVKSTDSMFQPPAFSGGTVTSDPSRKKFDVVLGQSKCGICEQVLKDPVVMICEHSYCRHCISVYWGRSSQSQDDDCPKCRKRFKTHHILHTPKDMGGSAQSCIDPAQPVDDVLQRVKEQHKTRMRKKYESLFEGITQQDNQTLLNSIYTQLYIIGGELEAVNEEHEVLQMEKSYKTHQGTSINCNDIFKDLPEPACVEERRIKTVLTKGIAGIGKTVSVQKFILDWAEGTANQDVDFMFVLPFRELNLISDDWYSLHKLLLNFHPELQDLDVKIYEESKVVFILDGLDENRSTLEFPDGESISHVTVTSSLGVLMSNLIRGDLLPSAHIWITSRPAAANQIPPEYIYRVTEIQGFTDLQKEEYFRKRITDAHQADRIISHIRKARSLYIMCHIPVFCWISSTVLQNILKHDHSAEIPKTLTEMYIHFLIIQMNVKNQKYDSERVSDKLQQSNREMIVKLSELAYKQLMKGNVMLNEEDLRECGINITDASVYSGICTEIFKEESVIHHREIYCFIHLSFQEFLAAFYIFHCFINDTSVALKEFDLLTNLYRGVIDSALQSETGHLDLFLRFLLGISLESNQRLLQDLLTHTENSSGSIQKIITYIEEKIKSEHGLSAGRSINLFLCLLEMKDQTMCRKILEYLKSEKHYDCNLSASKCSAIAYMLQMSENVLEELNLMKYNTTQEGRKRLLPAVINCRKALLAGCDLTDQCCEIVASALHSSDSPVRELDISNNDLQDSGVKKLCEGLKSPNCRLEILRLSGCMVTEEGCSYLASALSLNPLHLKVLDLSYNHPGHAGVQLLTDRLNDPNCTLNTLNVNFAGNFRIIPGLRKYTCCLRLDPDTANTCLHMSKEMKKVTRVAEEQLCPEHPERFEHQEQVMCRDPLSGRCYWEVEWTGGAYIAVTYKRIKRKRGSDGRFGWNDISWGLFCTADRFSAWHDSKNTDIHVQSQHNRVGVYLDERAGILSFYSISDTHKLTHIYTFHAKFTERLYAGFAVYGALSLLSADA